AAPRGSAHPHLAAVHPSPRGARDLAQLPEELAPGAVRSAGVGRAQTQRGGGTSMIGWRGTCAIAALSMSLVASCGLTVVPREGFPLPTDVARAVPTGVITTCSGIALASELAMGQSDGRLAWLVGLADGSRTDIVWPVGYRAVFGPDPGILSADGTLVLRDGDFVSGGCLGGVPGTIFLEAPFLALRLRCGPMPFGECTGGRLLALARANGWPSRAIDSVRFVSAEGDYELLFEDGTTATGVAPSD
ncbi:MAG: hypothetical protein OEV29_13975, partial [Thermoleophilia bacterium]|nr:hypothetical protein [Thermoleophilia bacterium]